MDHSTVDRGNGGLDLMRVLWIEGIKDEETSRQASPPIQPFFN